MSPKQARRNLDNEKRAARREKRAAARERLLARRARKQEFGGAFQLAAKGTLGRGVHSLFKTVAKEIKKDVPEMGEPGSEVAPFIPEPRTFSDVVRLPVELKKPWLRATKKEIKNLIDNKTFKPEDPEPGEVVTPCMDVYKAKIASDGTIDKLKLRIVVRGDLQSKEQMGDTWSPTASLRMLKFFLAEAARHRDRVNQLDFIGAFLQAEVKERIFVKLHERYAEYFPEYQQYFGRPLRLLRSMYGMTISG